MGLHSHEDLGIKSVHTWIVSHHAHSCDVMLKLMLFPSKKKNKKKNKKKKTEC